MSQKPFVTKPMKGLYQPTKQNKSLDPRFRLVEVMTKKIEVMSGFGDARAKQRTLKQLFSRFDADSSGVLTKEQFFDGLNELNCLPRNHGKVYSKRKFVKDVGTRSAMEDAADWLFETFDTAGNGVISLEEFTSFFRAKQEIRSEQEENAMVGASADPNALTRIARPDPEEEEEEE